MLTTDGRKPYAVYVITKHGVDIARKIQESFSGVDLYVSPKFIDQAPEGSSLLSLPMDKTMKDIFTAYDCHIFIISVGAVVRMIAPLMQNKKVDPAVICIDDKAQFSVCVLSGHVGRGNFFAANIASALPGSIPVITTASDVNRTLTVDILGRDLGWTLTDMDRNVTRGCAAVVNETRVMFVQECGEPDWWPEGALPTGVEYTDSLDKVNPQDFEILLIASFRSDIAKTHPEHFANAVIYHPRTLVLGLGCDRDVPLAVVENGIKKVLQEHGLALQSVKAVATVDKKKDEIAFLQLCEKYGWEFHVYPPEELDLVEGVTENSEIVKKYVGTKSVSEAASLLLSGSGQLLVSKQKYREEEGGKNLTVAVSGIEYPLRVIPERVR